MKSIKGKILLSASCLLLVFGLFWLMFQYFHQLFLQQYNQVLERYLIFQQVSVQSEQLLIRTNDLLHETSEQSKEHYILARNLLRQAQSKVKLLQNDENTAGVSDYTHLIDSFIESTDLSIQAYQQERSDDATQFYRKAEQERSFITETTLSLVDHELTIHERLYAQMIQSSKELQIVGWEGFLSIMAILIGCAYWFSRGITRSIALLTKGARFISAGVYDQPIKVESNDETAFLAQTFDQMRVSVKRSFEELEAKGKLEQEVKEYQYLLKEMEWRNLQNQMKPHFLFNTLNTLAKKAYLEGSVETSDLITTVAELMRYQLAKADVEVTLAEEIEMIRNYMTILQARFTDRLKGEEKIDPACLHVPVPSFLLQPLVENAFIHGIESREEGGRISIGVRAAEHGVQLEVADDGVGMSQDQVRQIMKGMYTAQGQTGSVGLSNVIRRLSLYYHREDLLQIQSEVGKGTSITILIPATLGERGKLDDSDFDRR
ncbi:Sensor histidine kinase YesM [Thermoactinomyces sp. DSM 45891]|uniref:sensor histidine kinase n=1 Tax=Thermoactinomyces sp. DSM 45891 TaxID=1761907 RepID=UPI00091F76E0|nr:sensor histidine kinase [Thermoactinomyces sp. DSM 45891]SFX65440.1 Sensor histidine kinase YesM [Thermoactinomyces sp. DSM 45891]